MLTKLPDMKLEDFVDSLLVKLGLSFPNSPKLAIRENGEREKDGKLAEGETENQARRRECRWSEGGELSEGECRESEMGRKHRERETSVSKRSRILLCESGADPDRDFFDTDTEDETRDIKIEEEIQTQDETMMESICTGTDGCECSKCYVPFVIGDCYTLTQDSFVGLMDEHDEEEEEKETEMVCAKNNILASDFLGDWQISEGSKGGGTLKGGGKREGELEERNVGGKEELEGERGLGGGGGGHGRGTVKGGRGKFIRQRSAKREKQHQQPKRGKRGRGRGRGRGARQKSVSNNGIGSSSSSGSNTNTATSATTKPAPHCFVCDCNTTEKEEAEKTEGKNKEGRAHNSMRSHLYFGSVSCEFCKQVIANCHELKSLYRNAFELRTCQSSPTQRHLFSFWWVDPYHHLTSNLTRDLLIRQFCDAKGTQISRKEVGKAVIDYLRSLNELSNDMPWKTAIDFCWGSVMEAGLLEEIGETEDLGGLKKEKGLEIIYKEENRGKKEENYSRKDMLWGDMSRPRVVLKDVMAIIDARKREKKAVENEEENGKKKDGYLRQKTVKNRRRRRRSEEEEEKEERNNSISKNSLTRRLEEEESEGDRVKKRHIRSSRVNEDEYNENTEPNTPSKTKTDPYNTVNHQHKHQDQNKNSNRHHQPNLTQHSQNRPSQILPNQSQPKQPNVTPPNQDKVSPSQPNLVQDKPNHNQFSQHQPNLNQTNQKPNQSNHNQSYLPNPNQSPQSTNHLTINAPPDGHYLLFRYPTQPCPEECPECYTPLCPTRCTYALESGMVTYQCPDCGLVLYFVADNSEVVFLF